MIKKSLHIALFLVMSILDVRVKAADFTSDPTDCFQNKNYPCAIKNLSIAKNLHMDKVALSPKTVISWDSDKKLTLIKGKVLVNQKKLHVSTLFGEISIQGSAVVSFKKGIVQVEVYQGQANIDSEYELVVGMKTIIPGFDNKGELIVEAPQPLIYDQAIYNWQKMSNHIVNDKDKKNLKSAVDEVVTVSSNVYKKEIQRQIASHKKMLENKRQRRLMRQKEINKLNQLFKKKNYLLE